MNSKEENSEDFCPNYVKEFGLRRPGKQTHAVTERVSTNSQKHEFGIRDPEKPIPDPGVKKAPDPGSSATLCFIISSCELIFVSVESTCLSQLWEF